MIQASFQPCDVTEIKFSIPFESIDYQIGSGARQISLPEVIQKPDCGHEIREFKITTVKGSLARETLMTALSLDSVSKTLTIDTIDLAAFAGH